MEPFHLNGNDLTLSDVIDVARHGREVTLSTEAIERIEKAARWIDKAVSEEQVIYGITTGFGQFKNKAISPEHVAQLQVNLVRSHACGVGAPLRKDQVRASILVRINSLIKGYSGVRREVIEALLSFLNKDLYPYVPSKGSVGSSGDLAPLCHIMLVLLGEGECIDQHQQRVPSIDMLKQKGITPITLQAKEGLALSNGTSVQTGIAALALYDAGVLIDHADFIAALSVEVLMGSKYAFNSRIHLARNQTGQIHSAQNIASLLEESPIIDSHKDCNRVQDSYSLRCIAQIHGAIRDNFTYARSVVERELNAATDNPLVFPDDNLVLSGGNFHGEPIAIALDSAAIGISELGNISERRIAKMVDPATNEGLPAFLTHRDQAGLNSGLMIPQYTAAALVSENKVLAHPASVDSIPTSANQEDHVSMGTIAARKCADIVENVKQILAIELFNATQAYEFRKPAELSVLTGHLYQLVRKHVEAVKEDRIYYKDFEVLSNLIDSQDCLSLIKQEVPDWKWSIVNQSDVEKAT